MLLVPGECVDASGVGEELVQEGVECLEAPLTTRILVHAHT